MRCAVSSLSLTETTKRCTVPCWREELLAQFDSDACIDRADDTVPKWHLDLSRQPSLLKKAFGSGPRKDSGVPGQ